MGDIHLGESNFFSVKRFLSIFQILGGVGGGGGRGNCKLYPVLTNKTSLTKLVA